MARLPRLVVPSQPHHVIQRGNNRQVIFRDEEDHIVFLQWLREAAKAFKVAIHAYVLMPNHLHLLASPSDAIGLGRMMQWVGRHYVPYFNQKYARTGTLWEGRFKAIVIDSEQYFFICSQYIELNPVRAGIAVKAGDYPWSSYTHHVGAAPDSLITEHALYWALGNTPFEREAAYRQLFDMALRTEEISALNEATLKGWVLGSEKFIRYLEKHTNRRVVPGKRGRPHKQSKTLPAMPEKA
ncbi:MAG TPA: transposase [Paucimonas sp.]|nr:transposase [Paucimonas sp.]HJW54034.1 transposase [Burkholderiaceae bacterium]